MLGWKNKPKGVKSTLLLDVDQCLLNSFIGPNDPQGSETILSTTMQTSNLGQRERMLSTMFLMDGFWYDFCAVKRPGLDKFLRQARLMFDNVGIWTAGAPEYAAVIVEEIFRDLYMPDFILTRNDITYVADWPEGANYHKPLSIIEKKHPELGVDRRFTLFLDDTLRNFHDNPENGVHIPRYEPIHTNPFQGDDDYLFRLMSWLQSPAVINSTDVRTLDKGKIFASDPQMLPLVQTEHRMFFSPRLV